MAQLENRKKTAAGGEGEIRGSTPDVPPLPRRQPGNLTSLTKNETVFPEDGLRAEAAASELGTEVREA